MSRKKKYKAKRVGLPPGSIIYTGEKRDLNVHISVFDYNEHRLEEKTLKSIEECLAYRDKDTVSWVNLDGVHDTQQIEKLGAHYNIHPLVLEDIVHTTQRPKVDEHDNYLFIVLKMLEFDSTRNEVTSEQISLILGPSYVISFQENQGDVFDPIRERIRTARGRIRKVGPDYLAYALIDAIVDHYFVVLEKIGERIEELEEVVLKDPSVEYAQAIHALKRETILLRKAVWPLREVISYLDRIETNLINPNTRVFLKDVYDHTIQVIDSVESYRDIISGMLEIYLASVSNRMNEVMKVLTIISTIFIPLTFVVGVYGMNFEFMPELKMKWAYPTVMLGMLLIVAGMLFFFRKRKWI